MKIRSAVVLAFSLLLFAAIDSPAVAGAQKRKGRTARAATPSLDRAEVKQAYARLAEMGFGTGRSGLMTFQRFEGRKATGRLTREDLDAIMNAGAPQARDAGYKHVEVDLDRQVLLLTDDDGVVKKILPVSTGSNRTYKEKTMSGLAYTPRGRFRIYSKIAGWRRSPLGLLYYPSYFSDGLAIHGNPSVPDSPQSHGCIRIPMSAAVEMSRQLPVGTIVLIYDKQSFVSAKDWIAAGKTQ
jgi:lipoprotein-anchoring transpeptidase ErfK/SrfK